MNQSVSIITIGASDVERSKAFYSDGLGWKPVFDMPGEVAFYQVGHGLLMALWSEGGLSKDSGVSITRGNSVALAHNVDSDAEVAEVIEKARVAGAKIVKEVERAFYGGDQGYFEDPDGYLWEIAYNPGLTIAADGTVTLAAPD